MADCTISDFLKMQHDLAVEKGWIYDRNPEGGPFSLLWSMDELGEAIAIIKKKGTDGIMNTPAVREHFVEEVADHFMYMFDMMECFGITGEEFTDAYLKKWEHNIGRSWDENSHMYEKSGLSGAEFSVDFLPGERLAELLIRDNVQITVITDNPDDVKKTINNTVNDAAKVSYSPSFSGAENVFAVRNESDLSELGKRFGI